ncbi:MAG TPA: SCP2 sterol-binding domain-containing protein [Polyangiaceae bacterium]
MSDIPRSPARFFEEYAPQHVAKLGAALAGKSSPGAIAFDLGPAGSWSLRLAHGQVEVTKGLAGDTLVLITLSPEDFEAVIVLGAERLGEEAGLERQLVAVRVLTIDADRARLLRESPGTLLLRLGAPAGERRLTLTIGGVPPKPDQPDAELGCELEDLWAIQGGAKNPFELLMEGRLKISGDMQLAMALGAALGS